MAAKLTIKMRDVRYQSSVSLPVASSISQLRRSGYGRVTVNCFGATGMTNLFPLTVVALLRSFFSASINDRFQKLYTLIMTFIRVGNQRVDNPETVG